MPGYDLIECRDDNEWLDRRRSVVGASESRVLFGVGYADESVRRLYAQKIGIDMPPIGNVAQMEIAKAMEPAMRELFSRRLPAEVEKLLPGVMISRDEPRLGATPDGMIFHEGEFQPVELKYLDSWNLAEWDAGNVTPGYLVQVQHQIAVTGASRGWLCAVFGGKDLRPVEVVRDDQFIAELIVRVRLFWESVENRIEPDETKFDAAAWLALHERDNGSEVDLPLEAAEWHTELVRAKSEKKDATEREEFYAGKLKVAIGDSTWGRIGDIRYSLKRQDRKGYTVEPGFSRVLRLEKSKG